jgi:tRNA1Val (adenine37-N6)-methyltransferase
MSDELTLDEVRRFGLSIAQPVNGYRFSLDALLLAEFARLPAQAVVADLGAGIGTLAGQRA